MSRFKVLVILVALCLVDSALGQGKWVNGYTTRKGKYVQGKYRQHDPPRRTKKAKAGNTYKPYKPKSHRPTTTKINHDPDWVKGYTNKKGVYVPAHYKSSRIKTTSPSSSSRPSSSRTSDSSGVTIRNPIDSRFSAGDRLVSVKDSSGKTISINTESKLDEFLKSHPGNEDVTVKIRRDGKYLTRKVKRFGESFRL